MGGLCRADPNGVDEILELGTRHMVCNDWGIWSDSWMFMTIILL